MMGFFLPSVALGILQPLQGSAIDAEVNLHPGDIITAVSSHDSFFSFRAVVNRAGVVRSPLGVPIKAIGPSTEVIGSLGDVLEREIGRRLTPLVWQVTRSSSFRVEGAVRWGGTVRINRPMALSEVLMAVQPDGVADLSSATANRGHNWGSLDSLGGKVMAGDRLLIPTRDVNANVAVVGAVVRPATVSLDSGLTIEKCLQMVGGIALHGDPDRVEIWVKGSMVEFVPSSAFATRILVRGESLKVPRAENVFSVTIASFAGNSQVVEVRDGTKLSEVLKVTGVKPVLADGYVTVRGISREKPAVKGRFSEILSNPLADVFLSKGDAILVE